MVAIRSDDYPRRGGAAGRAFDGAGRRRGRLAAVALGTAKTVALFALLAGALAGFGFVRFASAVAAMSPPAWAQADGIVVLTGGADRISGGVTLLAQGRAERLLISGVNPATDAAEIVGTVAGGVSLIDCCIDLDRRAENTVGNAEETAKWAIRNGFHSLIVVTSAYHMPRSLSELEQVLPDVELIPHPVAREGLRLEHWYREPGTLRLLLGEYVKYIAAEARHSVIAAHVEADEGRAAARDA